MENLKTLLKQIDDNLDKVKRELIKELGGDEGHDIGDADSALELLTNQITEEPDHTYTLETVRQLLHTSIHIRLTSKELREAIAELKDLMQDADAWKALHEELYPGTKPFSGFMP